jgi:hypothetical protein
MWEHPSGSCLRLLCGELTVADESILSAAPRAFADVLVPSKDRIEAGFRWMASVRDVWHRNTVRPVEAVPLLPLRRSVVEMTDTTFEAWGRMRDAQLDYTLRLTEVVRREQERREGDSRELGRRSARREQESTG